MSDDVYYQNPRVEIDLSNNAGMFFSEVSGELLDKIRSVITDGFKKGNNPKKISLDIVGRIDKSSGKRINGLLSTFSEIENLKKYLTTCLESNNENYFSIKGRDKRSDGVFKKAINKNHILPQHKIISIATRYENYLLHEIASTLVQTEIFYSLNKSEFQQYTQASIQDLIKYDAITKEWNDLGVCLCLGHSKMAEIYGKGSGIPLNDFFMDFNNKAYLFPCDISSGGSFKDIIGCKCSVEYRVDWFLNSK